MLYISFEWNSLKSIEKEVLDLYKYLFLRNYTTNAYTLPVPAPFLYSCYFIFFFY